MRRTERIVTVAVLSAGLAVDVASAQDAPFDVPGVKPVLMLLVDTSGSMERKPVKDLDNPVATLPKCGTGTDDDERSRWAVTLEALTGSFAPYRCAHEDRTLAKFEDKYDFGYHIPHVNVVEHSVQPATDGLLDSYLYNIKFGVMTFDGVGTLAGRQPLMTAGEWSGIKDDESRGQLGMYSYGPDRYLTYPDCPDPYWVNFGVRSKDASEGALVAVEPSDNGPDLAAANAAVQASLLSVRPYGGTPIAAMLDDLKWALENDPAVIGGIDTDVYGVCRERFAMLLTDGVPDPLFRDDSRLNCEAVTEADGTDGCPYPLATEVAADLITGPNALDGLYVVALNVEDDAAMATLNAIAEAGGTEKALEAIDLTALRQQLNSVFDDATDRSSTRAVPVVTSSGYPELSADETQQFEQQWEITAGFRVGSLDSSEPWEGLLYRRRYLCTGELDDIRAAEGDVFHDALDNQSATNQRELFTIRPQPATPLLPQDVLRGTVRSGYYGPGSSSTSITPVPYNNDIVNLKRPDGSPLTASAPDLTGDPSITQGIAAGQHLVAEAATQIPFDSNLDLAMLGVSTDAVRQHTVNFVKGTTPGRVGRTLGDIYHSNPVVLPPLVENSRFLNSTDEHLSAYLKDLAGGSGAIDVYGPDGRPGAVFVGTNDGLLHAFNLDKWTAKSAATRDPGWEFWGFIPPALLGRLSTSAIPTHQELFDGTPQVKNMLLARDGITPTYRTVLVSALRGAPAFVALDVTYPDQEPVFLWQFATEKLGNTVATPALAQARIQWTSSRAEERALAILPGGAGVIDPSPEDSNCGRLEAGLTKPAFPNGAAGEARDEVRCWHHRGRVLYVVDVATGTLIQEFDSRHFPSPLTGSVAVDGEGLDISKAAYFTDQDGLLWRLSMVDVDPSKWRVEPIYDMFDRDTASNGSATGGRPSSYAPTMSRDEHGNNVILVGTGDVDNLQDSAMNRVVSLTEKRTVIGNDSDGFSFGGDIIENWEIDLEAGEALTGPISVYDKVAYYGTFRNEVIATQCSTIGESRLWGVHYLKKTDNVKAPANSDWPLQMMVEDPTATTIEHTWYLEGFENTLLLGVSIASSQMCMQGMLVDDMYSPGNKGFQASGGATGGGYQLRALMSGKGADALGNQSVGDLNQFQTTLQVKRAARLTGWGGAVD